MEAELEGDLLVGAGAFPDGDAEADGLEVEEIGGALVVLEVGGGSCSVEPGFASLCRRQACRESATTWPAAPLVSLPYDPR